MGHLRDARFLTRLRWIFGSVLLSLAVVTLWAQEPQNFTRGINVLQGNFIVSQGFIYSGARVLRDFRTATAESTGAAATYATASVLSGFILRTPGVGGNVTDVMPTAANLIAAMPGAVAGMSFFTIVDMGASPGGTVTLNGASTGVTYGSGCGTAISTGDVSLLLINITSATAYRVACMNVNT